MPKRSNDATQSSVDLVSHVCESGKSLDRVCFFRRANAWVKLPVQTLQRLERERGDFWWLLLRDQAAYRDVFTFRHAEVRHLLIPDACVERRYQGRLVDVGWNVSIRHRDGRHLLRVHGVDAEVDVTESRNARAIIAALLDDADAVSRGADFVRHARRQPLPAASLDASIDSILDGTDRRAFAQRRVVARRGQPAFRAALFRAYGGRCAVTGCNISEALQAAHLFPYRGQHTDDPRNGILLRADVHALFDARLFAIRPADHRLVLTARLTDSNYASLEDKPIELPADISLYPHSKLLDLQFSVFESLL